MNEWISTQQSSNIAGFSYDETNQTLTVEFHSGARYNYYDVPSHVYENMKTAPSYGKFLNSEIKGAYRYARQ
ncbi:KTSC domain-containing protein [Desulfovibrio sp. JC022]|uniref:KTSC domain-containing protein n=1 Tax=Desulfovibrio sp. JC022 TaxID=2593642 RepID=UPI0013D37240|nr:KTSC domain-containing protein [Desulfovibrio sp. JC022]NDV24716.1 KTSC domain-containing protein [Desulfovibrio sp. JC022]